MPALTDADLRLLRAALEPGETVEWAAQPDAVRTAFPALWAWVFGLPWTAFTVGLMHGTGLRFPLGTGVESVAPLFFGVPLLLVGFGLLSAPVWAYVGARRSAYLVTDRRALLAGALGRSLTIRPIPPEAFAARTLTLRPDGSGTIHFHALADAAGPGAAAGLGKSFQHVPDVLRAERLLADLAARALPASERAGRRGSEV